jgi:hypothetical protein
MDTRKSYETGSGRQTFSRRLNNKGTKKQRTEARKGKGVKKGSAKGKGVSPHF